jgi:hypothetical protein
MKGQKARDGTTEVGRDEARDEEEEEAGDRKQDDLSRETAKGWQREKSWTV